MCSWFCYETEEGREWDGSACEETGKWANAFSAACTETSKLATSCACEKAGVKLLDR